MVAKLETDHIYDTVIVNIEDGTVQDFLNEKVQASWAGDLSQPAINVMYQIKYGQTDDEFMEFSQLFTYNIGEDGVTEYNESSNLAKFKKKYGTLPAIGTPVKVVTDDKGRPRLKIE